MERTFDCLKVFGEVAPFKKRVDALYYGSMTLINTGPDEGGPSGFHRGGFTVHGAGDGGGKSSQTTHTHF